jgi:hypothetical protein
MNCALVVCNAGSHYDSWELDRLIRELYLDEGAQYSINFAKRKSLVRVLLPFGAAVFCYCAAESSSVYSFALTASSIQSNSEISEHSANWEAPGGLSASVNIKYRKLRDDTRLEGFSFYPLLRVFLRHEVNVSNVLALVDSGAADCVFPASIAELLGVDIGSGQQHQFHGFDNRLVAGFVHKLHLQVAGLIAG